MLPAVAQASEWPNLHAAEVQKLSTLLDISQALLAARELRTGLTKVLEIINAHHGAIRSSVVLLNPNTREIAIELSTGRGEGPGVTERNRDDDAPTGEVVRTGSPTVVPQASRGGRSPIRGAPRPALPGQELTYINVPISIDSHTVGALGMDLPVNPHRDYERTAKFLGVAGSMIAQAVRLHELIAADHRELVAENTHLRFELKERYGFSNIVGTSGVMQEMYEQISQVAPTNTTVLLRGESGTGKELIAHAIHYNSLRAKKPFIKVSCAALPQDLIESELFGYEKGAFTGAYTSKKGRFELAEGGTLFLDEIGELNLTTQVKLLRVLQEREFERLGGIQTIQSNVRLVTATNKQLEKAIASNDFREDLYYRLNVFAIFVPPLRERKPDILQLANHFLEKYSRQHKKNVKRIATPAIDMLMCYHWPGNVRELENAIERAVVVCNSQVLHAYHLPPTLQTAEASGTTIDRSLSDAMNAFEKDMLQDALKSTRGNRAKAARLLSTTARIFNYKIEKYNIDWKRFRS